MSFRRARFVVFAWTKARLEASPDYLVGKDLEAVGAVRPPIYRFLGKHDGHARREECADIGEKIGCDSSSLRKFFEIVAI